jgi:hypothetical protein
MAAVRRNAGGETGAAAIRAYEQNRAEQGRNFFKK